MSEGCNPISLHSDQSGTKDSNSVHEEHSTSDPLSVNQEDAENRIVLLHENEINCSSAVSTRNKLTVKLDNDTDFPRIASHPSLDMKGTRSEKEIFSSPFGEGQVQNGIDLIENCSGVDKRSVTDKRESLCDKAR